MKKVLLTAGVVLTTFLGFSQQDKQFTHYMYDRLSINPGSAGTGNAICATGIFRQQWSGFSGAPQTFLFNAQGPVNALRGGVGLTLMSDKEGFINNTAARLSYSYHLGLGAGVLGIGASVGMISKKVDGAWITPDTPFQTDNAIPNSAESAGKVDFGFGLYYKTNDLYMGLSTTHLSQSDLADVNIQVARHYYVVAGYNYRLQGDEWIIRPSVLAKSDAASTQIDLNVNVLYNKMIWAGVSYRLQDAISPMIGYQREIGKGTLKIGYSYDVTTSDLSNYSSGTHEIMLNYCFVIDPPPVIQKSKNVRFL